MQFQSGQNRETRKSALLYPHCPPLSQDLVGWRPRSLPQSSGLQICTFCAPDLWDSGSLFVEAKIPFLYFSSSSILSLPRTFAHLPFPHVPYRTPLNVLLWPLTSCPLEFLSIHLFEPAQIFVTIIGFCSDHSPFLFHEFNAWSWGDPLKGYWVKVKGFF